VNIASMISAYSAAVERIQVWIDSEKARTDLAFHSQARLQQRKTERALLIFHGVTNSPEQFRPLSELFFERGYNVFIPRHPGHGHTDRTGRAMSGYRLKKALDHASSALEITCGLGERITVVGLSGGANLCAWLAQTRPEIDLAVVMAPYLGIAAIPVWATGAAFQVMGALPDVHSWWDPRTKMENPFSPPFAYTGFMTHALQQMGSFGQQVKQLARRSPPKARRVLLIHNANDLAVNRDEIEQLRQIWAGFPGFTYYEIPKEAQVEHDFISLGINAKRNKALYPKLLELVDID
jgi:alpha-beta hydrolase superfamily lysophospholipase